MRASFVLASAWLSVACAEILAPSPSTSDPTITPAPHVPLELLRKQNNDRFMGWISVSGSWTSRTCDVGGTYFQNEEFWRCCATTLAGCNVPVGCVRGSLIYSITPTGSFTTSIVTYGCTEIYTDFADRSFTVCNTGYMYENTADTNPLTNVFCGISSVNWSYYRQKPAETSDEPSSTLSPSTPRSTSPGPTTPIPASPSSSTNPKPTKKKSKAWIAGAVVGPIAGLAILGALLSFCLVRRKKSQATPPGPAAPMAGATGPTAPPSYAGSPNPPPPQSYGNYYKPQMEQTQTPVVPFGVASHNSWAPQSPATQGSTSPQQPNSPVYPPPGQQWQPIQQPTSPQMLSPQLGQQQMYAQPSPPLSPQPQHPQPYIDNGLVNKQPDGRLFSSELDSTSAVHPQQQAR